MLNSDAAWSLLSNTNEVLRWIGTARAPVAGSGAAPACSARVSNAGSLWPAMSVGAGPLPSGVRCHEGRPVKRAWGFHLRPFALLHRGIVCYVGRAHRAPRGPRVRRWRQREGSTQGDHSMKVSDILRVKGGTLYTVPPEE